MSLEIVNMLIEYELLLAKLYGACSEHFPEITEFWKGLVREETGHADTLRDVLSQVDGREVSLNQKRFNIRPLEISMDHVREIIERVTDDDIDLIGILSLALDIEQSTIESKFYEVFAGRSREFNDKMKMVRDESRRHAIKIREMKQKVLTGDNSEE